MERKFLKDLGLEDDAIEKIMKEYGTSIQGKANDITNLTTKLNDANKEIDTYKTKITDLEKASGDNSKIQKELDDLKQEIADKERKEAEKKQDDILTNNIVSVIGDKKFVNDYTKNAIISDIKTALKDTNNAGKSAKDLFEELTKDKEGIFDNPNKGVTTPGMGDVETKLAQENHDRELLGLEIKK